jgi:hypothetical protein
MAIHKTFCDEPLKGRTPVEIEYVKDSTTIKCPYYAGMGRCSADLVLDTTCNILSKIYDREKYPGKNCEG